MVFYKLARVFKYLSFVHLLDELQPCACNTAIRLKRYRDPLTLNEHSKFCEPSCHVRTMNLEINQHPSLRAALKQGLNHIVLRLTHIA
jgi:hypothetical protein